MRKIFFAIMVVLLLNMGIVSAHEHDFGETKQLIDSGISCDKLTDEQLESIGDYYMEQMHPGEAHEMMDMMMGNNMMGSGMIGNYPAYYGYNSFWNILWLIFLIGVIVLIIWLIYRFTKKGKESETPINILQKRYAKGEINKKQFDEMKKELRK